MSSASTAHTSTRLRMPETVRLVNWPLRDGGPRIWFAGLAILGAGLGAGAVSGNPAMGAICCLALALSCWRLWLPVTFVLGTKGVTQSALLFHWRIPWRCIARYETRGDGVWLYRDAEPRAFSTIRGTYVQWTDQETQVLAVLDFFLAPRRQRAANTTRTYAS